MQHPDDQSPPEVTAPTGYAVSRHNAARHGILSRYAVLPWEDRAEYDALHDELKREHQPGGPTEAHLVEELAGIIWRKRRVRLAEYAIHHRALDAANEYPGKTVRSALLPSGLKPGKIEIKDAVAFEPSALPEELAEMVRDQTATRAAIGILEAGTCEAYSSALGKIYGSTRAAWSDQLTWEPADYADGAIPYRPDAESLKRYLEAEIQPWYARERARLEALPAIRAQALGESLDPDKLDRLSRYEVHLDRKFERTLSTLLRLQEIRQTRTTPSAA